MANRFKDFTAPEDSKFNITADLLEQDGVTARLYRRSTGDGFTTEIGDLTFVRNIMIIVSEEIATTGGARDKRTPNSSFNGLTNYKDVRLDDVLRIDSLDYLVTFVDKTPVGQIQLLLERLESNEY